MALAYLIHEIRLCGGLIDGFSMEELYCLFCLYRLRNFVYILCAYCGMLFMIIIIIIIIIVMSNNMVRSLISIL